VANDLPAEKNVFHPRPGSDVVNDHVAAGPGRFLVDYDSDVGDSAAEIPGHQIAGAVSIRIGQKRQALSPVAEEDHQVYDAPMIDVGVGSVSIPRSGSPVVRIGVAVRQHVLVDLFLQINPYRAIGADHLVRANAGCGRHISSRIGNADVGGIVSNGVPRAFDRRQDQRAKELFLGLRLRLGREDGGGRTEGCAQNQRDRG